MSDIRAILVWMCGVVTPSLLDALEAITRAAGQKPAHITDLARLIEQLSINQLSGREFCGLAGQVLGLEIEPDELRQKLLAELEPNPAVLEEIQKLPGSYQRWLVVDLPPAWYDLVSERMRLTPTFSSQRFIFLGKSGLPRLVPDIFYYLSRSVALPAGQCLAIDSSLKRAIEGINHAFPTHHYVSPRLLHREFYLRGFTGAVTIHKKPEATV